MPSSHLERQVDLRVDLSGSNCGPEFLSVNLVLAPPADWTDERIRQEAATYYAVPLEQVGKPRRPYDSSTPCSVCGWHDSDGGCNCG